MGNTRPEKSNPQLIVHRSTNQIGGNCIEITWQGHRLILDAGSSLDETDTDSDVVPTSLDVSGPVDGVIVSHPHQDHYGLLQALPANWPAWCGKPTEALMRLTTALSGNRVPQQIHTFTSFQPFDVGPFTITPFLTDHSAFDAHMVLVQVAGRKILYSGDFRRTGRKSVLVDRMLASPPQNVDVLLLEGTTLGRREGFPTESDLERRFIDFFREAKGRVFVTFSGQNIDRLVTIYRACKQSRRTLVLDLYSVVVLEQLGRFTRSLPQLGWPNLRAVVTSGIKWLYEREDRLGRSDFITRCSESGHAFGAARIESRQANNVIMLRPSLFRDYVNKGLTLTRNDAWVFSMWSGYLEKPEYHELRSAFEKAGARFTSIHTSGHASRSDLQTFAAHINAKCMVPIHSFDWDQYTTYFDGVRRLQDGESMEIA